MPPLCQVFPTSEALHFLFSLPDHFTQIFTCPAPSYPSGVSIQTSRPQRGLPCLPTPKGVPHFITAPSLIFFTVLMDFAYSFTCLLPASPVITSQDRSFMRAGTLPIFFTLLILELGTMSVGFFGKI